MILWAEIIMGFSSPCIGTPGGFEPGGMKSVSSGSNSSHANINSISSSIQPHSQGSLSFLIVFGERKALTSSLNSTHIIIHQTHYEKS